jgi:uroporphyrinogen-III decarboxylase
MDLSAEAEALGGQVRFGEHEPPTVVGRLVTNWEAAQAPAAPELGAGRLYGVTEALVLTIQRPELAHLLLDNPLNSWCVTRRILRPRAPMA